MHNKVSCLFFIAASMAASANPCPGGAIEYKGIGKTAAEAEDAANRGISRDINSMARSVSKSIYSRLETEDDFQEHDSLFRESKVETYIPNLHAVKNKNGKPPYKEENGNFVSERYICRSDAAKPYLDSLEINLRNKLKVLAQQKAIDEKSCSNTREIFAKMLGWQRIAEHLKQLNVWQKEYEKTYMEIEKKCLELESSVFVFVTGSENIQNKATEIIIPGIQTMLSENNITVAEKQEGASHVLNIDAKVCNAKSDERFYYANACVKVTLTNVRTGKNDITITVNGRKEGALNEYNAGEKAFKSATVEVWTKIKSKIMEISL
jgi:hypothetical protein